MPHAIRKFTVHGRVQGVWFRDSTRREAHRLGLQGHAVNLPDGTVEVLAVGPADAVAELERWLQDGPPIARVTRVEAERLDEADVAGFRIG